MTCLMNVKNNLINAFYSVMKTEYNNGFYKREIYNFVAQNNVS